MLLERTIDFFSFSDPNVRYVTIGSILLICSSALVGCFTFLRKRALLGDAVAHSVLPGICLGFMIAGNKNPIVLLIGAFIAGWLSTIFIDLLTSRTRIKEDTALGLTLAVFFGLGLLLLSFIQNSGNGNQSGLDHFLFGKAALLIGKDLWTFGILAAVLIVVTMIFYKEFLLVAFDEAFAKTIGLPVKFIRFLLTTLTVLAVVIGIQAVGVILMSAMLITPAVAARFWTDRLRTMIVLALIFGAVSGVIGSYISYVGKGMPTGPWIVLAISFIALMSIFFSPYRGLVARRIKRYKITSKILTENILKAFYHLGEKDGNPEAPRFVSELTERRDFNASRLKKGLRKLRRKGFVSNKGNTWKLTEAGVGVGKRVTRLHRLWEIYLTKHLSLPSDHVHEAAEAIEHIITPEIEAELEKLLEFPDQDPHQSKVPY